MPTYTPRNIYVLCAAFAGCQSGLLGQTVTGSTTPSYWQDSNSVALAWAESFDTEWAAVVDSAPDSYELSAIEELSKTYWLPRNIGPLPVSTEATTYEDPVDIIIAMILNGETTLNGVGIIPPPTPASTAVAVLVSTFGAKADGILVSDAAIGLGSAIVTCATSKPFTSTRVDVGKVFRIGGAGVAGATLLGTIRSVTDSAHATLSVTAGTAVTAAVMAFGTDNAVPWQTAYNTLSGSGLTLVADVPTGSTGRYCFGSGTAIPPGGLSIQLGSGVVLQGCIPPGPSATNSIIAAAQTFNSASPNLLPLAVDGAPGATTITVSSLGTVGPTATVGTPIFLGKFVVGSHQLSQSFIIKSITPSGGNFILGLDRPLQWSFPAASPSQAWTLAGRPSNIHIDGRGALFTGDCQQCVEFGITFDSSMENIRCDTSGGNWATTFPAVSIDAASYNCVARNIRVDGGGICNGGFTFLQTENCQAFAVITRNTTGQGIMLSNCVQTDLYDPACYNPGNYGLTFIGLDSAGCVRCNCFGGTFEGAGIVGYGCDIAFGSSDCHVYGATSAFNQRGFGFDCSGGTVGVSNCSYEGCTALSNTFDGFEWLGGVGLTMVDCGVVDCTATGNGDGFNVSSAAGTVDGAYMIRVTATGNPGGPGIAVSAGCLRAVIETADVSGNGGVGMTILADCNASNIVSRGGNGGLIEIEALGTNSRVVLRDLRLSVTANGGTGVYLGGSTQGEITGTVTLTTGGTNAFGVICDSNSIGDLHDLQVSTVAASAATATGVFTTVAARCRVGYAVDVDGTAANPIGTPYNITGQVSRSTAGGTPIVAAGTGGVQSLPWSVVKSQERPFFVRKVAGGVATPGGPIVAVNPGVGFNLTFGSTDTGTYDYVIE